MRFVRFGAHLVGVVARNIEAALHPVNWRQMQEVAEV
jgi:hypothetical protein